MRHFKIKNFRGIEGYKDPTDLDRGALSIAEGVVATPAGSLRSGPPWISQFLVAGVTIENVAVTNPIRITATAHGLTTGDTVEVFDTTGTVGATLNETPVSVTVIDADNFDMDGLDGTSLVWSGGGGFLREGSNYLEIIGSGFRLVCQYVLSPTASPKVVPKMISTAVTSDSANPAQTGYSVRLLGYDDDGGQSFPRAIGPKTLFNKGAGLVVYNPTTQALDPFIAAPEDVYELAREDFPLCRSWTVGPDFRLYGAVNGEFPLRVFVSEPPNKRDQEYTGIDSSKLSIVDILYPEATRITALSTAGPNIVVHTDAGVVVLETPGPGQDPVTGMRTRQFPSPANAGAPNPNCVAHDARNFPIYFGRDKRLYREEAARRGNYGEPTDRAREDEAYKSDFGISEAFTWESSIAKGFEDKSFCLYDQDSALFFIFAPLNPSVDGIIVNGFYVYNNITSALTGPLRFPKLQTATLVKSSEEQFIVGLDDSRRLVWTSIEYLKDSIGIPKSVTTTGLVATPPGDAESRLTTDDTQNDDLSSVLLYPCGDETDTDAGLSFIYDGAENSWILTPVNTVPDAAWKNEDGDVDQGGADLLDENGDFLTI